jgi:low temperature requirement protein LtrA
MFTPTEGDLVSVRSALLGLRPAREGNRVTTLELFFDLVYVFAFTQVTGLMSHGVAPGSILDGFVVFALLWLSWCSYSWLANMARADVGAMRLALLAVSAAMFVACLAIPEAFHDQPGGLNGPLVLVVCYAIVRFIHIGVYLVVAGDDHALRHQVMLALVMSALPAVALMTVGVLLGEPWQRPLWLVAVLYELVTIFVTSRGGGGWIVTSAAHFAERHALVVLLALGESMVAIGTGAAQRPISLPIVVAAVAALAVAVGVWLHYFVGLAGRLEHGMEALHGAERARAGRDLFTYLHLPIVGGIILAALGIEQALAHLDSGQVGRAGSWAMGGGLALSIAGMAAAERRIGGRWSPWRIGAVAALILGALILPPAHPTLALVGVALVLVGSAAAGGAAGGPPGQGEHR